MRGYLGRDDLTAEVVSAGWLRTGDVGLVDERGCLYLRGREREEINKGGMKIYPADIDAVVERFEDAVDVCAFALEDALLGEDVGIAVVLRDGSAAKLGALREWMALHLARHQMPRRWYLVDEIPRTSRGKVNRSAVARRCAPLRPGGPARDSARAREGRGSGRRGPRCRRAARPRLRAWTAPRWPGAPRASHGVRPDLDGEPAYDCPLISSGIVESVALLNVAVWVDGRVGGAGDTTGFDLAAEWNTVGGILDFGSD